MSILPYWLYLEAEDLHADINPVTITKPGTAEAKKDPQLTTGHTGDDAETCHYRRRGHQPHKHRRGTVFIDLSTGSTYTDPLLLTSLRRAPLRPCVRR